MQYKFKRKTWRGSSISVIDPINAGQRNRGSVAVRVTRFGEFSPFGRLFTLGSFLKITYRCSANFRVAFSTIYRSLALNLNKQWIGFYFCNK
jgi:hypothetical protein